MRQSADAKLCSNTRSILIGRETRYTDSTETLISPSVSWKSRLRWDVWSFTRTTESAQYLC